MNNPDFEINLNNSTTANQTSTFEVENTPVEFTVELNGGARGLKGDKGDTGATGSPGPKGATGSPGQDGFSPIVEISKEDKTTTLNITDKIGEHTATILDGQDGSDGQDGFSPSASVNKSGDTATITIIDKDGTTTAEIKDGEDGNNGQDGFSPTVTTSKEGKTTTITITDANGEHTATILDGQDGQGTGDMLKSTYDTNNNGIVDNAEKVNNHTVEKDVPSNAAFTDTIYDDTEIQADITDLDTRTDTLEEIVTGESEETTTITDNVEINKVLSKKYLQLKGNTYQQTYTGKNLLPYPYTDTTKTVNGITFTDLGDGTIKVNGTASANASFRLLGSSSQQYTINGNYIYGGLTANIRVQVVHYNPGYTVLGNSIGTSAQINKNTYTTGYIEIVVQSGQVVNNQIIKPMLTSAQDNTWEKYVGGTASPNPDYPQSIENVTGLQTIEVVGKNLFNKNDITTGLYYYASGTSASGNWAIAQVQVQPNTNYYLSGNNYNNDTAKIVLLDSSKNITHDLGGYKNVHLITTNSNTAYIGLSIANYEGSSDLSSIQLEKGSQATTFEEYKGQKYNINLGKNLFDIGNSINNYFLTTNNGLKIANSLNISDYVSATFNNNSIKITNYNNTYYSWLSKQVQLKTNTTYTLSGSLGAITRIVGFNSLENNTEGTELVVANNTTVLLPRTFNSGNYKYYVICFYPYSTGTEFTNIQIEVGSQATSYSPYFTPIYLNKISDYQDRIYKQNNKWYLEKKIGKIVLNGSESFFVSSANRFNLTIPNVKSGSVSSPNVISKYYTSRFELTNNSIFISGSGNLLSIMDERFTTVTEFKTWLSNNPVEVDYVLATPEITEITNTDLIEQLESIKLLKGYNYVSIYSDNLSGILKLDYYINDLEGKYEYLNDTKANKSDILDYYLIGKEVKTNKVWNGKPVYRTVVYEEDITISGSSKIVYFNIQNLDELTDYYGRVNMTGGAIYRVPNIIDVDHYIGIHANFTVEDPYVLYYIKGYSAFDKLYTFVEYTKTTD